MFTSAISRIVQKKFPQENEETLSSLVSVWAEVLKSIIDRSQELFLEQVSVLHIDLKPEMTMSLINTVNGIAEKIVEARTAKRNVVDITPQEERAFYASAEGKALIEGTTNVIYLAWLKHYRKRWEPKSKKKLKKEKSLPQPKRRYIKTVETNHYIPRFILKKYWAESGTLTRHARVNRDNWEIRQIGFGEWGHQKKLYSDKLEDRFSLIEGDAAEPIRKILATYPLNDPERLAFLGYLVVNKLRNPSYRRLLIEYMLPVTTAEVGKEEANNPEFQRDIYETIFENNDLYDQIASPLLWSRWVMVRTNEPVFVLPDTASIWGTFNGHRILVAPLTPTACFVSSGILETEKRVIPDELSNDELARVISRSLIASCQNDFVSHSKFPKPAATGLKDELLSRACRIIGELLNLAE